MSSRGADYDRWLDEPYEKLFEPGPCDECGMLFEPDDLTEHRGRVLCCPCAEEAELDAAWEAEEDSE